MTRSNTMNEYITIGHIEEQIATSHPSIKRELLLSIVGALEEGTLEPLSLIEATQLQAFKNGWAPIPAWLYNESYEAFTQYLKNVGIDPTGADDFIHLYSDEWGEWYADISDLAEEIYQ